MRPAREAPRGSILCGPIRVSWKEIGPESRLKAVFGGKGRPTACKGYGRPFSVLSKGLLFGFLAAAIWADARARFGAMGWGGARGFEKTAEGRWAALPGAERDERRGFFQVDIHPGNQDSAAAS